MEHRELISIAVVAFVTFIGWLARERFSLLDSVERRTTQLEAKLNVLGDINEVLSRLKTDIAVIKNSLSSCPKNLEGKKDSED